MPVYNPSGPAEILRAEQKDEELCERIARQLSEFLLVFKGHIFVTKHKEYVFGASQVLYYSLTTLSRLLTLGEEYTRIIQVGKSGRLVPTFSQSVGMILAHAFGDRLIVLVLDRFIEFVRGNGSFTAQAKDQIVHFVTTVKLLVPLFQSLNKVLFYWNGSFYTWAKRIFAIRYMYATPWYRPNRPLHVFKILSVLTAVHLSVILFMTLFKNQKVLNSVKEQPSEPIELNVVKCSLCLEPRQNPSLSFCGHLFCWYCIHEWLQTNNFCPICRKALNSRNIVPLQNFN